MLPAAVALLQSGLVDVTARNARANSAAHVAAMNNLPPLPPFPASRPRRLRRDAQIRALVRETQAQVLGRLREQIKKILPGAKEKIFYQMPSFEVSGVIVLSYEGFKEHNSIFPGPEAIKALEEDLAKYKTSKGAIQFDLEKDFPARDLGLVLDMAGP